MLIKTLENKNERKKRKRIKIAYKTKQKTHLE